MSIIRYNPTDTWSPFDRLSSLRDLLDSAFQLAGSQPAGVAGWVPPLDVTEDEDKVVVDLELPGAQADSFDVSLQDGALTISGERKSERNEGSGESFRSERVFGRFERTVNLPAPVQPDAVTAAYTNGVLTVTLPKAEEAKPRKVNVEIH